MVITKRGAMTQSRPETHANDPDNPGNEIALRNDAARNGVKRTNVHDHCDMRPVNGPRRLRP